MLVHKVARRLLGRLRGLQDVSEQRAWEEARLLAEHLCADGRTPDDDAVEGVLRRRVEAQEPTAYITGVAHFWTLQLRVSPAVLIPRPCSEVLVETAVAHLRSGPPRERPQTVLDLGTGSGCLLLATLSEVADARGVGVDISADALAIAAENARLVGVGSRAAFFRADFSEATFAERSAPVARQLREEWRPASVVLCNPPYITAEEMLGLQPSVRLHEPHLALEGGEDGLCAYRAAADSVRSLQDVGALGDRCAVVVEAGFGQAAAVREMFHERAGLAKSRVHQDLSGVQRCVELWN